MEQEVGPGTYREWWEARQREAEVTKLVSYN